MEYKKCSNCKCYRDYTQFEKRKNGEIFKTCCKCRIKKADVPFDIEIKKEPELKEGGIVKIKGIEYEIKAKILDKELAKKLVPELKEDGKKYANIEDMPDENIVIPYECCNEIE